MKRFSGKRAIVTGAAGGIGLAIAERLASEGCVVSLWDIDGDAAKASARQLAGPPDDTQAIGVDVADPAAVSRALAETLAFWQAPPDILVNNAGIGRPGSVVGTTREDFERTMAVNVGGTFNCSREIVPLMKGAGGGLIINMASWFGKSGRPDSIGYCASKFAIIGMTQSMAIDLAPDRIRVNAVCPGTIADTGMREEADAAARSLGQPSGAERAHLIPLGRLGRPRDVANVVAFLASDDADYMTGQSINVTGGLWMN